MDPRHRDRIAFVRIVSGEFERGMSVNLTRTTGKGAKLSNVTQFMAESRENVENAVAGDIIGVYDTGTYQVGDTLTVGKNKFEFEPLPTFTPELFMKVSAKNVMKQKSFHKGIEQLVQEGAMENDIGTPTTKQVNTCLVPLVNFSLKFSNIVWKTNTMPIRLTPIGKNDVVYEVSYGTVANACHQNGNIVSVFSALTNESSFLKIVHF